MDRSARLQKSRSHFIANFKSSLTALVIYHHTAIVYGGLGSGPFKSSLVRPASSTALVGLNAANQSFFMASFMFISGHYSAKALKSKPTLSFMKDRLYRLGLPTVAYTLFIHPLSYAITAAAGGRRYGFQDLRSYWSSVRGPKGPVWFTGTLLAFDLVAASYKHLTSGSRLEKKMKKLGTRAPQQSSPANSASLVAGLTVVAGIDFLVRTLYPLESSRAYFAPLGVNLGYLPQYIAAYILGASSISVHDIIPSSTGFLVLLTASVASSATIARSWEILRSREALGDLGGGFNRFAASYAIWNNFTGYLLGSGTLHVFAKYFDSSWGWVNDHAYTAFLIHMPISTFIEVIAEGWHTNQVAKWAAIGTANTFLSWSGGLMIDRLLRST